MQNIATNSLEKKYNPEKCEVFLLHRECPSCGLTTIKGMPGGRDATCENCGYKDPCCYD